MEEIELERDLKNDFFLTGSNILSDSYIRKNKNILWVNDKIDLMVHVPNYMLWCLKYRDEGNLICDYTISALAEFGRNKNPKDENLNF